MALATALLTQSGAKKYRQPTAASPSSARMVFPGLKEALTNRTVLL